MFWMAVALSLITTNIRAEECRTVLNESDRYKDLNAILSCFAKRISTLESESKTRRPTEAPPAQSEKPVLLYDNSSYFSVYTSGYPGYLITDKDINFNLVIKNKSNKEIYLAWENGSLIIVDENGLSSNDKRTNMANVEKGDTRPSVYSTIGPGGEKPVSINFKRGNIKGNKITLGGNIQQIDGDKHYYNSISWRVSAPNN